MKRLEGESRKNYIKRRDKFNRRLKEMGRPRDVLGREFEDSKTGEKFKYEGKHKPFIPVFTNLGRLAYIPAKEGGVPFRKVGVS